MLTSKLPTPPWAVPDRCEPKKKPTKRQIKKAVDVLAEAYPISEDRTLLITRRQGEIALMWQIGARKV